MNWLKITTTLIVSSLLLVACGTDEQAIEEVKATSTEQQNSVVAEDDFPTTIVVNDNQVTIEEKPKRILPLSLDVTEVLLQLVDTDRIVAISKSLEDPMISTYPDIGDVIEERVGSAVNIDPEQILSYDTDLLLLTKIHGQEADADQILSKSGIPILSFETIDTMENYMNTIKHIGQAVGEEEKAREVIETMQNEITTIQQAIPSVEEQPTVLVLSEVGPGTGPYILGPTNISHDLITLAGGIPAHDLINLDRSTKADVEQVINMNPDHLFLLDWQGNGKESYKELIESPGWNTLDAVKNDRVTIMPVKYLMNPNRENIEGLRRMIETIYGGL